MFCKKYCLLLLILFSINVYSLEINSQNMQAIELNIKKELSPPIDAIIQSFCMESCYSYSVKANFSNNLGNTDIARLGFTKKKLVKKSLSISSINVQLLVDKRFKRTEVKNLKKIFKSQLSNYTTYPLKITTRLIKSIKTPINKHNVESNSQRFINNIISAPEKIIWPILLLILSLFIIVGGVILALIKKKGQISLLSSFAQNIDNFINKDKKEEIKSAEELKINENIKLEQIINERAADIKWALESSLAQSQKSDSNCILSLFKSSQLEKHFAISPVNLELIAKMKLDKVDISKEQIAKLIEILDTAYWQRKNAEANPLLIVNTVPLKSLKDFLLQKCTSFEKALIMEEIAQGNWPKIFSSFSKEEKIDVAVSSRKNEELSESKRKEMVKNLAQKLNDWNAITTSNKFNFASQMPLFLSADENIIVSNELKNLGIKPSKADSSSLSDIINHTPASLLRECWLNMDVMDQKVIYAQLEGAGQRVMLNSLPKAIKGKVELSSGEKFSDEKIIIARINLIQQLGSYDSEASHESFLQ